MDFQTILASVILLVMFGLFGYGVYLTIRNSLYGFKEKELQEKAAAIFESQKSLSWTILIGVPLFVWFAAFISFVVPASSYGQRTAAEYEQLLYLTAWALIPGAILGVCVNALRLTGIAKTQMMVYLMKRVDELAKENENLKSERLKIVK